MNRHYDKFLTDRGLLTTEQADKLKKDDDLMWLSRGMYVNGVEVFPSGWAPVKFDRKFNSQGSPVVSVEYLPGQYVDSCYHNLKLANDDELFEGWGMG